jgi:hypothetical protein
MISIEMVSKSCSYMAMKQLRKLQAADTNSRSNCSGRTLFTAAAAAAAAAEVMTQVVGDRLSCT